MLAWACLGKWDILSSVLGAELLRILISDLLEKTNCMLIKCTDVSLGAVGNSSIKTDLERQIHQKGGEMSNPAWILVGKEQLLVPMEEVGMLWGGRGPSWRGGGDVLWAGFQLEHKENQI